MGTSLCKDVGVVNKFGESFNFSSQKQMIDNQKAHQNDSRTSQINQNAKKQLNQQNIAMQQIQIVLLTTPELSEQISKYIKINRPFQEQLCKKPRIINYNQHIFQGQTDQLYLPTKYGKLFVNNGDLLIGKFYEGQAHGQAIYIFKNGDYYKGIFKYGVLSTQSGLYHSEKLNYQGSFKQFLFDGQGKQTGLNHQFLGIYQKGKKKEGVLMWDKHQETDQYDCIYEGKFNQFQQFDGFGNLQQLKGIYQGHFLNGQKHGKGTYSYKYGLKYVGLYKNGVKQGEGTLYNHDDSIAYCGQWKNGYPDGQGYIIDQYGNKHFSVFQKGVHTKLIQ